MNGVTAPTWGLSLGEGSCPASDSSSGPFLAGHAVRVEEV